MRVLWLFFRREELVTAVPWPDSSGELQNSICWTASHGYRWVTLLPKWGIHPLQSLSYAWVDAVCTVSVMSCLYRSNLYCDNTAASRCVLHYDKDVWPHQIFWNAKFFIFFSPCLWAGCGDVLCDFFPFFFFLRTCGVIGCICTWGITVNRYFVFGENFCSLSSSILRRKLAEISFVTV